MTVDAYCDVSLAQLWRLVGCEVVRSERRRRRTAADRWSESLSRKTRRCRLTHGLFCQLRLSILT